MANDTAFNTPVLWINKYLQAKIGNDVGIGVPFFPTVPSTIDALTEQWIEVTDESNDYRLVKYPYSGIMSTWDRMFKMNKKSFPHIKSEQVLYYFYATEDESVPLMVRTSEKVYRLLDRMDESAEEVNSWCSNHRVNLGGTDGIVDNMFYFHSFKVYQLEETRDIVDFGTARTYAGNKIIIDFEYHQMQELTENSWTPGPKLTGDDKITI